MTVVYRSYVEYDVDAGVWFTEASTVPGLGASAKDVDQVVEALNNQAPRLLQANVYRREDSKLPKYTGPEVVEHEVVVIDTSGRAIRKPASRIDVYSLL